MRFGAGVVEVVVSFTAAFWKGQQTVRYFASQIVGIFFILVYSCSTTGQSVMILHSPAAPVAVTVHAAERAEEVFCVWINQLDRMSEATEVFERTYVLPQQGQESPVGEAIILKWNRAP